MNSLAFTHKATSRDVRPIPQAGGLPNRAYADKQSHKGEVRAEIFLRVVCINFDDDTRPVVSRLAGQSKTFAPWGCAAERRF